MRTLKQLILEEARRLGFVLAGVTTPEAPPHLAVFEDWLAHGRHASMHYLATGRSRLRRADPTQILPGCQSILVLAVPYAAPAATTQMETPAKRPARLASYAGGNDYHDVLPPRLRLMVQFIEGQVGHAVANRWYTDSGPILERDLAQRAGLGWIGKNTCLINPRHGSYFLLAEILLGLELEPDAPFQTDQCGTCTRCMDACPTDCILPDRTIDAGRCISYLTIELKDKIPDDLRPALGDWIFGCDVCQSVCPWNRFAGAGDPGLAVTPDSVQPDLPRELQLSPEEFNRKFKNSPVRRAKRRGYLRNAAVALGNTGTPDDLPTLEQALRDPEPLVREHAAWAIDQIQKRYTR
ncbi:MAG TPA: tRNA epoxyqueuosine(34) reductase QueG [Anaerolineales bacterium]